MSFDIAQVEDLLLHGLVGLTLSYYTPSRYILFVYKLSAGSGLGCHADALTHSHLFLVTAGLPHQGSEHLIVHLLSIINLSLGRLSYLRVGDGPSLFVLISGSILTQQDVVIFLVVFIDDERIVVCHSLHAITSHYNRLIVNQTCHHARTMSVIPRIPVLRLLLRLLVRAGCLHLGSPCG